MILLFLACTGAADSTPTGPCTDAPTVTYDSFGRGFLKESCETCHSSTASDRHGAPDEVVLDNVEEAWAWKDRIIARAAVEPPTMPPQGGTSPEDREKLRIWLGCGVKGE
jgi:hypothetical protein